jgi:hypothetical protein
VSVVGGQKLNAAKREVDSDIHAHYAFILSPFPPSLLPLHFAASPHQRPKTQPEQQQQQHQQLGEYKIAKICQTKKPVIFFSSFVHAHRMRIPSPQNLVVILFIHFPFQKKNS